MDIGLKAGGVCADYGGMSKKQLAMLRALERRIKRIQTRIEREAAPGVGTPVVRRKVSWSNEGKPWPKWVWETVTADNISDGYYLRAYEAKAALKEHCPGGRIIKHSTTKQAMAAMDQECEVYAFRSFIEDICGYGSR